MICVGLAGASGEQRYVAPVQDIVLLRPIGAHERAQVHQSPALRQEVDLLDGDGAAQGIALAHWG
jgi:hypothetical protein